MSIYAYLDWNVFNKIEKLDQLENDEKEIYSKIKEAILNGTIIVPYSNAHISDLARGWAKNPAYTDEHIKTIETLTNNLCIVQYWGKPKLIWHYRQPREFLESTLAESKMTSESFSELMYMDDEPVMNAILDLRKTLLKLQPVPEAFKEIYKADPIFNQIYPRTKAEMNMLALCEDLYQFSNRIKTDYVLYKNFQKFLVQLRLKFPQYQKMLNNAQQKIIGKPNYLNWEQLVDRSAAQFKSTSTNADYDKIMSLFTTTDLKGYSPDERFANMIDDALHCFYAAHCDYFVTIDKRCSNKARKVYEKLKLNCSVLTPQEFYFTLQAANSGT